DIVKSQITGNDVADKGIHVAVKGALIGCASLVGLLISYLCCRNRRKKQSNTPSANNNNNGVDTEVKQNVV
ncbi:15339_t:CDS:2, partial [Entrophospora sp. SA101]